MGNFSRKTFDKLKHYVGVRLQQGVPIVDADWNEMEDIRKYELQAFLKWFVGNGVPAENDGFRIQTDMVIIQCKAAGTDGSTINVDLTKSSAAAVLGFDTHNSKASSAKGRTLAAIAGNRSGPFQLSDNTTLVISANGQAAETVTFTKSQFSNINAATVAEVVAAIKAAQLKTVVASEVGPNNFLIRGGDGTPEGAGRCLVEGWDVINENNITYTEQPSILALTTPTSTRTDTVYLDVWEREVNGTEDRDHLVNPAIGIETCVRLKREWVVRVAEGQQIPPATIPEGHVFYVLAQLNRKANVAAIANDQISDKRRIGLAVGSQFDIQQITTDAFGSGYTLDRDGQPDLKLSLRETINALLRGEIPSTPELDLTTPDRDYDPFALEDNSRDLWVFWSSYLGC